MRLKQNVLHFEFSSSFEFFAVGIFEFLGLPFLCFLRIRWVKFMTQEKFVQEQKETAVVPDYGYHGTRVANIPSILTTGLKVPGADSGVGVANGSAHGVGIYTGMPGEVAKDARLKASFRMFQKSNHPY